MRLPARLRRLPARLIIRQEASSQTLVGQMWVLQEADKQKQETITADALFEIRMSNSIGRFLEGLESDAEMYVHDTP